MERHALMPQNLIYKEIFTPDASDIFNYAYGIQDDSETFRDYPETFVSISNLAFQYYHNHSEPFQGLGLET